MRREHDRAQAGYRAREHDETDLHDELFQPAGNAHAENALEPFLAQAEIFPNVQAQLGVAAEQHQQRQGAGDITRNRGGNRRARHAQLRHAQAAINQGVIADDVEQVARQVIRHGQPREPDAAQRSRAGKADHGRQHAQRHNFQILFGIKIGIFLRAHKGDELTGGEIQHGGGKRPQNQRKRERRARDGAGGVFIARAHRPGNRRRGADVQRGEHAIDQVHRVIGEPHRRDGDGGYFGLSQHDCVHHGEELCEHQLDKRRQYNAPDRSPVLAIQRNPPVYQLHTHLSNIGVLWLLLYAKRE